jgi:hypothetical protein
MWPLPMPRSAILVMNDAFVDDRAPGRDQLHVVAGCGTCDFQNELVPLGVGNSGERAARDCFGAYRSCFFILTDARLCGFCWGEQRANKSE